MKQILHDYETFVTLPTTNSELTTVETSNQCIRVLSAGRGDVVFDVK